MDANELLKKIRRIEIKTRGLSNNIFAGEYHSAFKGRGMTFSEVREYRYGDDIRDIDWNVTARHNHPYVKVYEEERELTVMLLVDMSASRVFGAVGEEKREMIAEIAATLAFSATTNNDKVGVIFFTDKIEKFIPPKKGKKHILLIIRELLNFTPVNKLTDISMVLRYFSDAMKKRCSTFLISDFIDSGDFSTSLSVAANRHDVYSIQVYDKRDAEIPDVGLVKFADLETGRTQWINTSSKSTRKAYSRWWYDRQQTLVDTFKKNRIIFTSIPTDEDYVTSLMGLFGKKSLR